MAEGSQGIVPDPQQIGEFFRMISAPELGVVELRAIPGPHSRGEKYTAVRGYFREVGAFVRAATRASRAGWQVYATLNPVEPGLYKRSPERLSRGAATRDGDICAVRWLWVDVDPERPSGQPIGNAERAAAWAMTEEVVRYLREPGRPRSGIEKEGNGRPVVLDSGNGFWVLVAVPAVAVTAQNATQISAALRGWGRGLARRFNRETAKIDLVVYNLSRIVRVAGTINWKGPGPWRIAQAVTPPVRCEQEVGWLRAAAAASGQMSGAMPHSRPLETGKIPAAGPVAMGQPGLGRVLERCRFVVHCRDHAVDLAEPLWYDLAMNLAPFAGGQETFRQLSAPYRDYRPEETDRKLAHASQVLARGIRPTTCRTIATHGFICPRLETCPAKAPVELAGAGGMPQSPTPPGQGEGLEQRGLEEEDSHSNPLPSSERGRSGGEGMRAAIEGRLGEIAELPKAEQADAAIDLVPRIVQLEPLEVARYRQRLKRMFGVSLSTFDALVQALHKQQREGEPDSRADRLPRRVVWNDVPRPLRQGLDYHQGRVYTVVALYERLGLGEGDREAAVRRQAYVVTSDRELVPLEPAGLLERGLLVRADEGAFTDGRWSPAGVRRFIEGGYAAGPAAVFKHLVRIFDYFIEFQPVGEMAPRATCHLAALDVMKTYFLPVFSAIGYPLQTGEKESGKTKLQRLQAKLSFLGEHITAGATTAALKRMADIGYSLYFDDLENIREDGFDPDKRAIILAGNTRGVTVPLVEEVEGRKVIRRLSAFCQKGFTNIRGVDDVLGSRVYLIPMVRATDKVRSSRDPDATTPPVPYQGVVDDLYTLALTHMAAVETAYRGMAPEGLSDREFQIWQPILALAQVVDGDAGQGEAGVVEEMRALALAKRVERSNRGEQGFDQVLVAALVRLVLEQGKGMEEPLSAAGILEAMQELAPEVVWREEGGPAGWPRGLAIKLGRTLKNLNAVAGRPRKPKQRGYSFDRRRIEALAAAYGSEG